MTEIHKSLSDITEKCPEDIDQRSLWINNIEMSLSTNTSGIRWQENNRLISCILESEIGVPDAVEQGRNFNVDIVVPFSANFAASSWTTCKIILTCDANESCYVQIPKRIWTALNKQVYSMLVPKIPSSLQHIIQYVSKYDAHSLILHIR